MEPSLLEKGLTHFQPDGFGERTCWVCLDCESDEFKLISPCKCLGNLKYAHEECIKVWVLSRNKDLVESECENCKEGFIMKFLLDVRCRYSHKLNAFVPFIIFPVLIILMSGIFIVIFILLVNKIAEVSEAAGEIAYLTFLLFISAVIIVIIVTIFARTIRKSFCVYEIISWSIEQASNDKTIDEISDPELPNITQNQEDLQLMIFPKFSRLKGKTLILPKLSPNRLEPIFQEGELIGFQNHTPKKKSSQISINSSFDINESKTLKTDKKSSRVIPSPKTPQ
jgi:E3 ubiquitin-protein ligase DOA10